MKLATKFIAAFAILTCSGTLFCQQAAIPVLQNVVQLSASGSVDVGQDLLSISMSTTRDGADANGVQSQLKTAIDAALSEAKTMALSDQLEVRTGNFSLYPRYGRDGKPNGWQGTAELILQGRDFNRISATAGKIQTLSVSHVSFGLSREQRIQTEAAAQDQAISRFKTRATDIARGFGFVGYTLREINVSTHDQGNLPHPRMLAMQAKTLMDEAPIPVEAGKATVLVTVSGSIQLK